MMSLIRPGLGSRIYALTSPFFRSSLRWKAAGCLALLVSLSLGINGLNVANSYVGRDFMSALAERRSSTFLRMTLLYLLVFAASTVIAVFYRNTEQRFGVAWRRWLTANFIRKYLAQRTYFRLLNNNEIDNPDQRIAEDVKTFTATLLSFSLMVLNATVTLLGFAGVLISIGFDLAIAALGYSALGCVMTILIGRRLVRLNNNQFRREADFRYELIRVRDRAFPIALASREGRASLRLLVKLKSLIGNFRAIIRVDRNIGFFVTAYNYVTPVLPLLIVAPRYMRGEIEFGVVTHAAMAFAQLTGALTLIVTQIDQLSSFAAVVERLGTFQETIEQLSRRSPTRIELVFDDSQLTFENVTLERPSSEEPLVRELSWRVRRGRSLLILGPTNDAAEAIFRASAGLWDHATGRIIRPSRDHLLFLPQEPHICPGTLRYSLLEICRRCDATDKTLRSSLTAAGLESLAVGRGGLDANQDWDSVLSLADRQRLAIAGLLVASPPFAFLKSATDALAPSEAQDLYRALESSSITFISIDDRPEMSDHHADILHVHEGGSWNVAENPVGVGGIPSQRS